MESNIFFTLLYDEQALPGYKGVWGLSFWSEIKLIQNTILFDTGWNGGYRD